MKHSNNYITGLHRPLRIEQSGLVLHKLLLLMVLFGLGVAIVTKAHEPPKGQAKHEADSKKLEIPKTLPAIWSAIQNHQKELYEALAAKKLADVHHIAFGIRDYVAALPTKSTKLSEEKQLTLKKSVMRVASLAKLLDEAGDSGDSAKVVGLVIKMDSELKVIEVLYAAKDLKPTQGATETPKQVYACPMHPDETSDKPANCSKCGMKLELKKSDKSSEGNHGHLDGDSHSTIKVNANSDGQGTVGSSTHVLANLSEITGGKPVTPEMLKIAHTQKVHLLIIDRSLTDYHHEHPIPTGQPGEYAFTFTPSRPGPYRIWADLLPMSTSKQEYVFTDLQVGGVPLPITDTMEMLEDATGGLKFTLAFDKSAVKVGEAAMMTLKVFNADGSDFKELEPVMGAFAHVVGFETDLKTILHIHPMGAEPTVSTERGGPSLMFHLEPKDPGFIRLFAQIQVEGNPVYARFGLNVSEKQEMHTH